MWLPPKDPTQGAGDASNRTWHSLYTLDHPDVRVGQDIGCDLNLDGCFNFKLCPATINDDAFCGVVDEDGVLKSDYWDEIHAYEVLEHLGNQGDAVSFFTQFTELWRILKPGGHLLATTPSRYSAWLWGDPSHRRAILPETLIFLDQTEYQRQCDDESTRTPMSDFRHLYTADFRLVYSHDSKTHHSFILQAVKPSRYANG
jgi:hypothetical protein